jgi:hypothetical protein
MIEFWFFSAFNQVEPVISLVVIASLGLCNICRLEFEGPATPRGSNTFDLGGTNSYCHAVERDRHHTQRLHTEVTESKGEGGNEFGHS